MSIVPSDIREDLALAEASAWLVRLQTKPRPAALERAFHDWLREDARHAHAFDRVTAVWELIPAAAAQSMAPPRPATHRRMWLRGFASAVVATVVLVAIGLVSELKAPLDYHTGPGERQTVVLSDGSKLTLNANTRLSVDFTLRERRIKLSSGEALFEVNKSPLRSFVVESGDRLVKALGTTFLIRHERDRVEVVLVEGRVQVDQVDDAHVVAKAPGPTILVSGQRLVAQGATTVVDRPPDEVVTAWRRGEVTFDDVTLREAIAEVNRYGTTPIRVLDEGVAHLKISGVFATRNAVEFASVVANLYGLDVVRNGDGIELRAKSSSH